MSTPPAIWPPIETPEKLLREIGPVGTPAPDRIAELTAERDDLRAELAAAKDNAALLRAEVGRLRAAVRDLSARPEVGRDAMRANPTSGSPSSSMQWRDHPPTIEEATVHASAGGMWLGKRPHETPFSVSISKDGQVYTDRMPWNDPFCLEWEDAWEPEFFSGCAWCPTLSDSSPCAWPVVTPHAEASR